MSLMVTTAIAMFALSWINTRAVDGALIASGRYDILDAMFRSTLVQSTAVMVALPGTFLVALEVLRRLHHPLAERLLPPLPLGLLITATILNHIVSAEATYLRAHKREAFLPVFVYMAAVTALCSVLLVKPFGASGMMFGLVASVSLIGVGGGTSTTFGAREHQTHSPPFSETPAARA